MTTPDVPLRLEMTFELPGTPEQVWDAIATGEGISSWFIRTDLEGREGGAMVTYMGEDMSSPGEVTGWDPPRRLEYVEPEWAKLTGHEDAEVTPLVSEFLVEAQSGGTCVVRVVSSAFGTGADWEQEFFDAMRDGWEPFFTHLDLYLRDFAGQHATDLEVTREETVPPAVMWGALAGDLGMPDEVGKPADLRGLSGHVHRAAGTHVLVRLTDPYPGYAAVWCGESAPGKSFAQVHAYLFHPEAENYVEREEPGWKSWLDGLTVSAG
jgi:uncharacterized protein YndB with AHSA1/START domain